MVLCLCEGVSDQKIRAAVRDGAETVGAIARRTGAGRDCGSCVCDLARILRDERDVNDREAKLSLAAK
ncbi:MAG: (2Fe-2S)-binding protein [Myxococcota bacterium]